MNSQPELQSMLEELIHSKNVYFQPPASIKMNYPAIRYSRNNIENKKADDSVYSQRIAYQLTVIDYDPDSEITKLVSKLPYCSFNTSYASDNLNHDVFTLYY